MYTKNIQHIIVYMYQTMQKSLQTLYFVYFVSESKELINLMFVNTK